MDTHFAPSPALDQEADALRARLPGELENDSPHTRAGIRAGGARGRTPASEFGKPASVGAA